MQYIKKSGAGAFIFSVVLASLFLFTACGAKQGVSHKKAQQVSDHFDGNVFFNPQVAKPASSASAPVSPTNHSIFWYVWHWILNNDRPDWPEMKSISSGAPPSPRVLPGVIRITTVGHSTFLIQMDGLNILTDPIWSERCSPVSWAGPKRHKPPGISMEDLPAIDVVLVSHNHYDHLDLPTLNRLAKRGTTQAIAPLGNFELIRQTGISVVNELDWWQSVPLSSGATITLVPAQHFSSRTPWDRNETLWGGFVISGPSGNIYYSGDTGYAPHFREIARRFSPIRAALLPISPFRSQQGKTSSVPNFSVNHMGPSEAVLAHIDLKSQFSIAAHFQVFQLGWDGFDDAVRELSAALKEHNLKADEFLAPSPGELKELSTVLAGDDKQIADISPR